MSEWVPVCETEGAQPVEIETDDDGTMPLASITAHFPGTTTLKFRAPVKIFSSTLAARVSSAFSHDLIFSGWDCLSRREDEGGHPDPPHGRLVRGHLVHCSQPQRRGIEAEA